MSESAVFFVECEGQPDGLVLELSREENTDTIIGRLSHSRPGLGKAENVEYLKLTVIFRGSVQKKQGRILVCPRRSSSICGCNLLQAPSFSMCHIVWVSKV